MRKLQSKNSRAFECYERRLAYECEQAKVNKRFGQARVCVSGQVVIPDELMVSAVLMLPTCEVGQWTNGTERYEIKRRFLWILGVAGLRKNDSEITDMRGREDGFSRAVLPNIGNLIGINRLIFSYYLDWICGIVNKSKNESSTKNISLRKKFSGERDSVHLAARSLLSLLLRVFLEMKAPAPRSHYELGRIGRESNAPRTDRSLNPRGGCSKGDHALVLDKGRLGFLRDLSGRGRRRGIVEADRATNCDRLAVRD